MRLNASQHMRLEQTMKLSPRIIQAMEILQLPMMSLLERIEEEMQSNPVLEMKEADVDDEAPVQREEQVEHGEKPLVVQDKPDQSDDFERLADFSSEYEPDMLFPDQASRAPADTGERDKKLDAMANTPAPEQTLAEYLLDQWAFIEAAGPVKAAGRLIIEGIDDDGYLRAPLDELCGRTAPPTEIATLREALGLVQTLDPIGVAARDLKECLLLQLRAQEAAGRDVSLEKLLVERYLRDIEMNHLPHISRRAGRPIEDIKAAIVSLSHLNPRPGRVVGRSSSPVISPDIVVDLDDGGEVRVRMTDGNTPDLHISRSYQKLARDKRTARDARQFLQKNIRSAQWLISAIQQRRDTVRRVAQEVFQAQKGFLLNGPEALKPLPMMDIATKVGVHVATVSRAVAGKYAQTPWGILPLRDFFSGGTTTASGQDVSWDAVKLKLKELVDAEDKREPLDDETLAREMTGQGITIARRTVAKYRDLMGIPPARKRKQF